MARFSNNGCLEDCLVVQAVAGLSVGVVLTDPSAHVLWLNRSAARILNTSAQDCVGKPIEHLFKDPNLSAFWLDANERDGEHHAEFSAHWPTTMELKASATRFVDAHGAPTGRALLLYDITAERTVQVTLSQAVATRLLDLTSSHMPPTPVANLSFQELKILRLVGRGKGNDEIAAETNISASTVRSHLKNLYRKLNLASRSEAVSFAVRNHLV